MTLSPRLHAAIALAASVAMYGCGAVRLGDIEPPPDRVVVTEIEIRGNRNIASADIVSQLFSQTQGLSVAAKDALVDLAEVGIDARRVESICAAHGYFQAHVTDYGVEPEPVRTATLWFEVDEGPPTLVEDLHYTGWALDGLEAEGQARIEALRRRLPKLMPLKKGDVWNEDDYLTGLKVLETELRNAGFAHARVVGDNYVSRSRQLAGVYYRIRHGPLTRIQAFEVTGNGVVPSERIKRRIRLKIGDVVEPLKFRDVEQRIYELGMFFSVRVRVDRDTHADAELHAAPTDAASKAAVKEDLPASVGLIIEVQETPVWDASIGIAASTDSASAEFRLPLRYTNRDILSEQITGQAVVQPALHAPDLISADAGGFQLGWLVRTSLETPTFFEEFLRFQMRAQYERDASELVTSDELTASMGVSRFIVPRLTGRLGVNLSYINRVGELTLGSAEALQTADFRLIDEDLISFFDIKFVLDLRDGLYDARSGFYSTIGADMAFANTASDVSFTRLSGDFRGYIKVASWLTFATRLRLGINLFPEGQGTPEQARFTAGGQGSNRGFSNGHMGDYACDTGSADADGVESFINQGCGDTVSERTYIGGNYLVDSSAELRFYLSDLWSLVAFADVGQLWSKADQIALDDLVLSTGPGVRLLTPVGPLRLDLGIRTTGEGTGEIRLHFSLGQAF